MNECHCGRPATDTEYAPNMGDYCEDCTTARCDIISVDDCPFYRPRVGVRRVEGWRSPRWFPDVPSRPAWIVECAICGPLLDGHGYGNAGAAGSARAKHLRNHHQPR